MSKVGGLVSSYYAGRAGQIGFTLIEVMVALALTATVAVLAYQSLSAAADANESVREYTQQMDDLDRTWRFLQADLQQAIDRVTQQPGVPGESFAAVGQADSGDISLVQEFWFMRLVRSGWQNPLGQLRNEFQGVAYQLQDGTLSRASWPVRDLDEVLEEHMSRRQLLDGVETMELRFLPRSATGLTARDWVEQWPQRGANASGLPRAVEITLQLQGFGESRRLFVLLEV